MTRKRKLKKPEAGSFNISPVPRPILRLIIRIWLADKVARREAGFTRSTRGILQRLADEFGVSRKLVRHLVHKDGKKKGRRFKRTFTIHEEKEHAIRRTKIRRTYTDPAARS